MKKLAKCSSNFFNRFTARKFCGCPRLTKNLQLLVSLIFACLLFKFAVKQATFVKMIGFTTGKNPESIDETNPERGSIC
jgi:hypothetical protein